MFQFTKHRLVLFLLIGIGGIGAIGEASLLYHELKNTLPYKELNGDLYSTIAISGLIISPILGILFGFLSGLKRVWLASVIPVVSSPLIFAIIFKTVSVVAMWSEPKSYSTFLGGEAAAAEEFYFYSLSLTVIGLIIGSVFGFPLFYLTKYKKLP